MRSWTTCSRGSTISTRRGSKEASTRSTEELGARDFLRGRRITVDGEDARAVQIQRDGRLRIETSSGEERALESGEVLFAA